MSTRSLRPASCCGSTMCPSQDLQPVQEACLRSGSGLCPGRLCTQASLCSGCLRPCSQALRPEAGRSVPQKSLCPSRLCNSRILNHGCCSFTTSFGSTLIDDKSIRIFERLNLWFGRFFVFLMCWMRAWLWIHIREELNGCRRLVFDVACDFQDRMIRAGFVRSFIADLQRV